MLQIFLFQEFLCLYWEGRLSQGAVQQVSANYSLAKASCQMTRLDDKSTIIVPPSSSLRAFESVLSIIERILSKVASDVSTSNGIFLNLLCSLYNSVRLRRTTSSAAASCRLLTEKAPCRPVRSQKLRKFLPRTHKLSPPIPNDFCQRGTSSSFVDIDICARH